MVWATISSCWTRAGPLALDEARARAIADRRTGVGCDQLITLEPSSRADVFMRIRNADGGEVEACGNATRCIARLLFEELGRRDAVVETNAGLLAVRDLGAGRVSVDMGPARLGWDEIPLAREMDSLHLPLADPPLVDGVGVNIGNPHAVFFVEDAASVDLATIGPRLEHDSLFPERANISVAEIQGPNRIRLRVWERGVGITRACGTAACATAVAAHRRGLAGRRTMIELDGGELELVWRQADGHVLMSGDTALSFTGVLADDLSPAAVEAAQ